MLFPAIILPLVGVDQGKWITVMAVIFILAIPAVFLEYYFTRERVTEENMAVVDVSARTLVEQLKGCFKSRYWVIVIVSLIVYNIYNNIQVTSSLYYYRV